MSLNWQEREDEGHTLTSLILFFTLSLLTACEADHSGMYGSTLELSDSLHFPLDSTQTNSTTCIRTISIGDRSFLLMLNKHINGIDVFDLNTKLSEQLIFPYNGPDGIGVLSGFFPLHGDTILLSARDRTKYYVANLSGEVISVINYGSDQFNSTYYSLANTYNSVIVQDSSGLYIPQQMYLEFDRLIAVSDQFPIFLRYEFSGNEISALTLYFPSELLQHGQIPKTCSVTTSPQHTLWSIQGSMSIYEVDFDKSTLTPHEIASQFFREIAPMEAEDIRDLMEYTQTHGYYHSLFYDPYRNLYYRTVKLPADKESLSPENARRRHTTPEEFSIITFDHNFKILDETRLPKSKYAIRNMTIIEDGILIKRIDGKNENTLTFDVFNFQQ